MYSLTTLQSKWKGIEHLKAGQCVAFEAIDGPKGLHAMSIKVLEEVTLTPVTNEDEAEQPETRESSTTQNKPEEALEGDQSS